MNDHDRPTDRSSEQLAEIDNRAEEAFVIHSACDERSISPAREIPNVEILVDRKHSNASLPATGEKELQFGRSFCVQIGAVVF